MNDEVTMGANTACAQLNSCDSTAQPEPPFDAPPGASPGVAGPAVACFTTNEHADLSRSTQSSSPHVSPTSCVSAGGVGAGTGWWGSGVGGGASVGAVAARADGMRKG